MSKTIEIPQQVGKATGDHSAPIGPVRIEINGAQYEITSEKHQVAQLKKLGGMTENDILGEIRDGNPIDLANDAVIEIHGGEVFHSHKHLVTITINSVPRDTHPGKNSVKHLRNLGQVPVDEIFSQFKDGQFVDLPDHGHVEIQGGEVFASHRKSGGSS